jgi:hypothetical protein
MTFALRAMFLSILLICLLGAALAPAKDGRDFAGFYEVSNVTDLGEEVSLTLTVRIFNYSGGDVEGAIAVLSDAGKEDDAWGEYAGVSVAENQSTRLSADFTVSRQEYERWLSGSTPALRIEYQQPGNAVRRMVELTALPVGEE